MYKTKIASWEKKNQYRKIFNETFLILKLSS